MTITEFTKQCRAKQGAFREEMDEPMGVGPWRSSKHKHTNMILDGEVSGKNFVNEFAFNYAKKRVANKKRMKQLTNTGSSTTSFLVSQWLSISFVLLSRCWRKEWLGRLAKSFRLSFLK